MNHDLDPQLRTAQAAAFRALLELATTTRAAGEYFAEILTELLAALTVDVGGTGELLGARSDCWEAHHIREWMNSAGVDQPELRQHYQAAAAGWSNPEQPTPPKTTGQRVSSGEQREQRRRDRAAQTIAQAWPGELGRQVLATVTEHDAFGALAYKLDQAAHDGADPVAILREIDEDTLTWAITDADDPAAFLASRIGRAS